MQSKISVLQVIPQLDVSGASQGCIDVANYLIENHHNCVVMTHSGKRVKNAKNKDIKVFLCDPKGSALNNFIKKKELIIDGTSITEGIGSSRVTSNFSEAIIDDSYSIGDTEALNILFTLMEKEGLFLGTSSGINVAGAIRLAKELGKGKTIITVLCDKSDRYHSKIFNKKFLLEKNLPIPSWL